MKNFLIKFNFNFKKNYLDKINSLENLTEVEKKDFELVCVFNPNKELDGHTGYLHGGAASTILDTACGAFCYINFDYNPCMTAYLNINFKKPVITNEEHYISIKLNKLDNRK